MEMEMEMEIKSIEYLAIYFNMSFLEENKHWLTRGDSTGGETLSWEISLFIRQGLEIAII